MAIATAGATTGGQRPGATIVRQPIGPATVRATTMVLLIAVMAAATTTGPGQIITGGLGQPL